MILPLKLKEKPDRHRMLPLSSGQLQDKGSKTRSKFRLPTSKYKFELILFRIFTFGEYVELFFTKLILFFFIFHRLTKILWQRSTIS